MTLGRTAAAALALALALGPPAEAARTKTRPTSARAKAPAPSPTPDPRPDRALFDEAQQALASLKASTSRQAKRAEWEKVVARFRRVVAGYPQSGYCDDALLAVGHLYRQMATRFQAPGYRKEAAGAYRALVAGYPSSRHAEEALFAVLEMAKESGDPQRIAEAAQQYLDTLPEAARAKEARALMKKSAPAAEAALPRPGQRGLAQLFDVRLWSGDSSTRVVMDVDREVKIESDRIQDPDRLWIDLIDTRMHPNLKDRAFPAGDGLLEQIRVAENRAGVVRVVLHFKDVKDHSIFYLKNPTRLVVDVRGATRAPLPPAVASQEGARVAGAASTPTLWNGGSTVAGSAARAATGKEDARETVEPFDGGPAGAAPAPPVRTASNPPAPMSVPPSLAPPAKPEGGRTDVKSDARPSRRPPASAAVMSSAPAPAPFNSDVARALPAPEPPEVNRAGSYSLARQLGLSARRIVIDAGHGGHDPGSIGPAGLQEKELVLDVALRLSRLVREELGAEVLMTRAGDTFIPLEERTAIANSKGADLFLSIHANSSRNHGSRGVETYFLNFAADPHAESVAARENAVSAGTMKDLQHLVKAITLNSKIDESRDFAASVQEGIIGNLREEDPKMPDRGVRTAPFYVLIGANMPSILAEIAFISHPDDERHLREAEHRQRIAEGLLAGVRTYLSSLDRTGTRLTALRRSSTVAMDGGGK